MRKSDEEDIRAFLKTLAKETQLGQKRWVWPRYVYRFDDVKTVAAILNFGALLSRNECSRRRFEHRDQANTEIIRNTQHLHCYARLFFRPRTPTQYSMEGIHPRSEVLSRKGAHCPVPVFMLFSSVDVLTREGVLYTDGSPARLNECRTGTDAVFLKSIPFSDVYSDGSMGINAERKRELTFRRQAEVLVPTELDLAGLQAVVCRSDPERLTLLYLLGDESSPWISKVRAELPGEDLFFRKGVYIESITFIGKEIVIRNQRYPGRFTATCTVSDPATDEVLYAKTRHNYEFQSQFTLRLPRSLERVLVKIVVDDAIAFWGELNQVPEGGIVR